MKKEQKNKNIIEFIKQKIEGNNEITRREIAKAAKVSTKTIERALKEIDNLRYVGSAKGALGVYELTKNPRFKKRYNLTYFAFLNYTF